MSTSTTTFIPATMSAKSKWKKSPSTNQVKSPPSFGVSNDFTHHLIIEIKAHLTRRVHRPTSNPPQPEKIFDNCRI
ncbi:hypothetical protein MJO28_008528 [Puccinia striiformis f. sp. tritici]|uniref:Uncharacterized protein n=1 Tax=Puccinia striiformis f. sp. tritici TaxID=168172 RepID=A0ACC0ED00_9BASI|nr:hypothetical protein MJO28_008528 [Puccinia striiformis f. sp. tritici]